jgi:hypothetical protein
VKLEITEEDHQFIETIVQQFDPAKLIERKEGVSDADWAAFTEPFRHDLRDSIKAAMIARALRESGIASEIDVSDLEEACGLNTFVKLEAEAQAYDRASAIVQSDGALIKPWLDETQSVVDAIAVGAGV